MEDIVLVPPNLAALGVKRATPIDTPDLITLAKAAYPVLEKYGDFCNELKLSPFAGGTFRKQVSPLKPGYITSGYRDNSDRENSPHLFALAIDVFVGDIAAQIRAAEVARKYFVRIGLYPDNHFIHLDLANEAWMLKYHGRRYWVRKSGQYTSFDDLSSAIRYAEGY